MKNFAFILSMAFISACGVNHEGAEKVLKSQGMKDVEILGYSWFGCGKEDTFKSNFKAVGSDGEKVEGSICSGWFKGYTVRFD